MKTEEVLQEIKYSIDNKEFIALETERIELKDLSTGTNWTELYKSVCAFLNTEGGRVFIGIKEQNKDKKKKQAQAYKITGFNYNDENRLKEVSKQFTNEAGLKLDLSEYFPTPEIIDFQGYKIAIIYVLNLPKEDKFVYYKNVAYKRLYTGDPEITASEVQKLEEEKEELINAQELHIIEEASLETLNHNKLNIYINELNKGKFIETLKANLQDALSFITRKRFIRDNKPTLLGMLVCGDYVEDYLMRRCEIDCYVIYNGSRLQDKQILKDNIIGLIKNTTGFVYRNTQISISRKNGGTASPEYPAELIEEHINNAVAHRDYRNNSFIILEIRPNESITIKNPGNFRQKQRLHQDNETTKVRRIIPIQYARNPRLTDLLKSFNYWEGKGKGLASLTEACLKNEIDVPYYFLGIEEVKLVIPKGKVYDERMELLFNSFEGYLTKKNGESLTEDEKIILSFFYKCEQLNRLDRYTILLTSDNNHKQLIVNLEEKGLLFKAPNDNPETEIYPVYLVDRILIQTSYKPQLKELYGEEFEYLSTGYQEVLETIFQLETYGKDIQISANYTATFIFIQKNGKSSNVQEYEAYRAKVRNIFRNLEKKKYIYKPDSKKFDFRLNRSFKKVQTLF